MSCNFKFSCQIEPFITGYTYESCSLFNSKLLCNLPLQWYSCPTLLISDANLNLLSQATHMNPVCSLIQNYFAIWFCGDYLFPALSSSDVKMNLLSQATHMNLVCSLIQDYFAIWLCGDIHVLHFQVQMSTWIFCHRPHTWILFALWFKATLQSDFVMIFMSCTF